MKIGSSLALICTGAILAFAVTSNTSFFNIHTAGWVIMLVGVIGLLLPRTTAGWLGRRLLVRRTYPGGRVEHIPVPPYVARNPGTSAIRAGLPSRPTLADSGEHDLIEEAEVGPYSAGPYPPGTNPPGTYPRDGYPRDAYPPEAQVTPRDGLPVLGDRTARPPSPDVTEVIEDLYEEP